MQIIPHQIKALAIYKKIRTVEKEVFDKLEREGLFSDIKARVRDILTKEKIDPATANILNKIFIERKISPEIKEFFDKISETLKLTIPEENNQTIILSSDGDLYRNPKEKYCYRMHSAKKTLAVLRMLGMKYTPTSVIRERIGIISNSATRKIMGTIKAKARIHLKLNKNKPIIESKGEGYRINHFYKFIKK